MQAPYFNNDQAFSPLSISETGDHPGPARISSRVRAALTHTAGSVALAVIMLAQPAGFAAPSDATTSVNTNSTTNATTSRISAALPSTGAPAQSQYFAPTGRSVGGEFLGTLQRFGVAQIGYPLTEERQENGRTVQYFERVRMERHPELAGQGFGVLMTRLGVDLSANMQFSRVAPFKSTPSKAYVPETGHSLAEPFLSYWKQNGGLQLFGYPLSEPIAQDGMTVQWFERARFEYHPEFAASSGHVVELSHLGKLAYERTNAAGTTIQAKQVSMAAPAVAQAQSVNLSGMESYVLKAINEQRSAAGLGSVQLDATVTSVARSRSSDMAARNYFSHTTPEGTQFLSMLSEKSVSYQFAGEILARNNYPDDQAARVAIDSYLNSAPHKAIMLDGRFGKAGVGYARSDKDAMHYFTVIFVQQ